MKEDEGSGKREGTEEMAEQAIGRLDKRFETWSAKCKNAKEEGSDEMNGFNRVVMMGRLTRDPQVKQLPSGISVADMRLAVSEHYKTKKGEAAERTCFVDMSAWGKQADTCGEYLKKGSPVLVEGRLEYQCWDTKEGQKRSKHLLKADRVQFLNGGEKKTQEREDVLSPANAAPGEECPF